MQSLTVAQALASQGHISEGSLNPHTKQQLFLMEMVLVCMVKEDANMAPGDVTQPLVNKAPSLDDVAAPAHCSVPLCAGQGPYSLSYPCWTCAGSCQLNEDYARLGSVGYAANLSTTVTVPGGGPYRLAYTLSLDDGQPNAWRAVVGSVDGTFTSLVLEALVDAPGFPPTARQLSFSIPDGTTAVTLTLAGRHVRSDPLIRL
jgi:hypothetical protein